MLVRLALSCLACLLVFTVPGASAASQKRGVSGSAKVDRRGGSSSGRSGFDWPQMVYGGNAISFLSPVQVGIAGYEPRVRLGLQYDRQWFKHHWLFGGVGLLLDRGDFRTFRMHGCGLPPGTGSCGRGGVVGFDIWAGYAYKFYLPKYRFLVPVTRGGAGFSRWAYPNVRGSREQVRVSSYALTLRGGGGVRLFFLSDLAIGLDLNLTLGFMSHREEPYLADAPDRVRQLAVGLEILPLIVEYRF